MRPRWRRSIRRFFSAGGIGIEILQFLDVGSLDEVHRWNHPFPRYQLVDMCRAFRDFFKGEGLSVAVRGLDGAQFGPLSHGDTPFLDGLLAMRWPSRFGSAGALDFEVGPNRREELPLRALFFVSGGPAPVAFQIQPPPLYPTEELSILGAVASSEEGRAWAAELQRRLIDWVDRESCYRGHVVRPVFGFDGTLGQLEFVNIADAERVRLPGNLERDLELNFLEFFWKRDVLSEAGVDTQRGMLLCGPPGTGKTSTCLWLKGKLPDHTFITVGSEALSHLKEVFTLTRRLSPAVVVIEDVDGIAPIREPHHGNWLLSELLNQMDGLQARENIGVLLTSNSWEFLEKALVDRPGRVDHVILFEPPADDHRRVLLEHFAGALVFEGGVEELVGSTGGLTPAQLKELVKKAAVSGLKREGIDAWRRTLYRNDLAAALEAVRSSPLSKGRKRIGILSDAERARG